MEIRTGTAKSGDLDIYYEDMGDQNHPPVLLIMGLGAQLLLWRKGFCEKFVNQGLRVIRYDNRDVGLSSKVTGRTRAPNCCRGWCARSSASPVRRSTRSKIWPTTPPRCWTTSASTVRTSSARRWAA